MSYTIDPYELSLVEGSLQNDRIVQKALYDKYKDAMYTIALRITNNKENACDVVQEGFIQVFRKLEQYRKESSLGAWIKTIIVRMAVKESQMDKHIEPIHEIKDAQIVEWDDNLTGEYLEQAISQLPPGCRSVFLLIEVEGYSHKEAAEILNISEGTSKSQLFDAKKHLRKTLKTIMY